VQRVASLAGGNIRCVVAELKGTVLGSEGVVGGKRLRDGIGSGTGQCGSAGSDF